ncbi:MAG: hypothetical protein HKM93_10540 [Desulfobacteraceae bacterium]|nr:hypothetical protein [Desulfobacteraceae bacterium]
MKFIYISKKVETCIEALKKNDKTGTTLAKKVKCIIESLVLGTAQHHVDKIGSFTKYGENRIRNCRKYDLGCGYRLITLQRGETVFIPFLGTHDACQLWLENNSRLKDFNTGAGRTIRVEEKKPATMISKKTERADIIMDVPDLFKNFSDKDLRRVFSGLTQGTK